MTARPSWNAKARSEIFRDAGGVCHICTRKIAAGEEWQVEHPKARGLGGSERKADMRPAHVDCHKPKTAVEVRIMRKADRQGKKDRGLASRKGPKIRSRGFAAFVPNVKQIYEEFDHDT